MDTEIVHSRDTSERRPLPIRLAISEEELRPEEKCGFLVSEQLKRIQAVQLDLLNELLKVCKKNNIRLSVFAGTMLGVIRHHGFIPWDDDIDVCMTRDAFQRLCDVASVEFKAPYFFQTARSDRRFFCAYARLRNSETTGLLTFNNSPDYNNGIFIDVFVLDGIPDGWLAERFQRFGLTVVGRLLNSYYRKRTDWKPDIYHIGWKTHLSMKLSKCLARLFPYRFLLDVYDKLLSMYNAQAKRLGIVTHGSRAMKKYWLSREELEKTVELSFDRICVPVCYNYDAILTRIYGDYMKFPPVSKRGTWHQNIVIWCPDVSYKIFLNKTNRHSL